MFIGANGELSTLVAAERVVFPEGIQDHIHVLTNQKKEVSKKEAKEIQAKIEHLKEKLAQNKRGENHSQKPKGGFKR